MQLATPNASLPLPDYNGNDDIEHIGIISYDAISAASAPRHDRLIKAIIMLSYGSPYRIAAYSLCQIMYCLHASIASASLKMSEPACAAFLSKSLRVGLRVLLAYLYKYQYMLRHLGNNRQSSWWPFPINKHAFHDE